MRQVGSGEALFRQRQEQSKGHEVRVLLARSRSSAGDREGERGKATGRS